MPAVIRNIVVGYDGFERGERLPALAAVLAREHDARIHAVNVVPAVPRRVRGWKGVSLEELNAAFIDARRSRLEELLSSARKRGSETRAVVRAGSPHVELIREAVAVDADLLIVSDEPTRRDGQRGFGTVTAKLLRECPCPVLAKRDPRRYKHGRILAAVDVDPEWPDLGVNRRVLDLAGLLARKAGSRLVVFHAWELWGEHLLRSRGTARGEEVDELVDAAKREHEQRLAALVDAAKLDGIDVQLLPLKGPPRLLLPQVAAAHKIDLVVMGTVCRTGLKGLLIGNTAEKVLNELSCSVLAVKPDGFVSPVSPDGS
jgi:nucleotide-binding universal stress UspA family protein